FTIIVPYSSLPLSSSSLLSLLSFSFSHRRPPPNPTLFPYTTLFRSDPEIAGVVEREGHLALRGRSLAEDAGRAATIGRLLARREDRKSTRLNSSHQIISYAVFCLKKKKKKKTKTNTYT